MPVRGLRRIDPSEAEVVRRIFEAYAAGRSARRIAHDLNAEGVPGPRGAEWGASTISGNAARGNGILNKSRAPFYRSRADIRITRKSLTPSVGSVDRSRC